MVTQQRVDDSYSRFLLDDRDELALFVQFLELNPDIQDRTPAEQEIEFFAARFHHLTGNRNVLPDLGGVDQGIDGVEQQLALLQDAVESAKEEIPRLGITEGERDANRNPFPLEPFLFPSLGPEFEQDPTSDEAFQQGIDQFFNSAIGFQEQDVAIGSAPTLQDLGVFESPVRALQRLLSPASFLGFARGGFTRTAVIDSLLGDILADIAADAGAPPEVQAAVRVSPGLSRSGLLKDPKRLFRVVENIATGRELSQLDKDDISSLVDAFKDVGFEITEEAATNLLRNQASELVETTSLVPPLLGPISEADGSGELSIEEIEARENFIERNPGIESFPPIEQDNLFLAEQIVALGGDPSSIMSRGIGATREEIQASINENLRLERERVLVQRQKQLEREAEEEARRQIEIQERLNSPEFIARLEEQERREREKEDRLNDLRELVDKLDGTVKEELVDSGIAEDIDTTVSDFGFGTGAGDLLQAARDEAEARAHQDAITANLDEAIELDVEETKDAHRAALELFNRPRQEQQEAEPVLSPRPTEPPREPRIDNTVMVDEDFGFGTGAGNLLAEARLEQQRRKQEQQAATPVPVAPPFTGETDLAAEVPQIGTDPEVDALIRAEQDMEASEKMVAEAAEIVERELDVERDLIRDAANSREAVDRMDAAREAELEAQRLRESEQIAREERERLRAQRLEAQRLANERARQEREAAERAAEEQTRREAEARAESERIRLEEERLLEEKRREALRLANERARQERESAERQARREAEARAESDRIAREEEDRLEAARLESLRILQEKRKREQAEAERRAREQEILRQREEAERKRRAEEARKAAEARERRRQQQRAAVQRAENQKKLAARTTEVSSTSTASKPKPQPKKSTFGFGTGAGDKLAAHRAKKAAEEAKAKAKARTTTRPRQPNFQIKFEEENG